jgi:DNA-binding MarR family transcriptional regulator
MDEKPVGLMLKIITDKLLAKINSDLKSHGLTFSQGRVLRFLTHKGGTASQKEIEKFLEVSHPTVVGIVSRLEQSGFITTHYIDNNRNKLVELTPKAVSIETAMLASTAKHEEELLLNLSLDQIKELKSSLMTLYSNLE